MDSVLEIVFSGFHVVWLSFGSWYTLLPFCDTFFLFIKKIHSYGYVNDKLNISILIHFMQLIDTLKFDKKHSQIWEDDEQQQK